MPVNKNQMFETPIDRRVVDILIAEYLKRSNIPYPNWLKTQYQDAEFYGGWLYTINYANGADKMSAELLIKEYDGGFSIGVIPDLTLRLAAESKLLNVRVDDVMYLADSAEEKFWNYYSNMHPQCIKEIVIMSEEIDEELSNHLRNVKYALLDWCVSQKGIDPLQSEQQVLIWYIKEVEIPIMNDSSTGDLVHMFLNDTMAVDLDVVINHMAEETDPKEGHISIKDFISNMDEAINNPKSEDYDGE